MSRLEEPKRAPRLPRVEPVLPESRDQTAYNEELRKLRTEMGPAPSWSVFFRQLSGFVVTRAAFLLAVLIVLYVMVRGV